jgi:hypothetical protein
VQQVIEHGAHPAAGRLDPPGVLASGVVEQVAVLLDQGFGEPAYPPQRGAQVVGDRVGEGRQVLVGPLQVYGALLHPLFQARVQGLDLRDLPERLAFGLLAGRDVPVDLHESQQ